MARVLDATASTGKALIVHWLCIYCFARIVNGKANCTVYTVHSTHYASAIFVWINRSGRFFAPARNRNHRTTLKSDSWKASDRNRYGKYYCPSVRVWSICRFYSLFALKSATVAVHTGADISFFFVFKFEVHLWPRPINRPLLLHNCSSWIVFHYCFHWDFKRLKSWSTATVWKEHSFWWTLNWRTIEDENLDRPRFEAIFGYSNIRCIRISILSNRTAVQRINSTPKN